MSASVGRPPAATPGPLKDTVIPAPLRISLRRPHADQRQILDESAAAKVRFHVLCCGRRWGKNVLGLDRIIQPALHGFPVAWFSPSYKVMSDDWRAIKKAVGPIIAPGGKSEQEHRLDFVTGGSFEMWSMDSTDAGRGRKYRRVAVDEAAMVPQLQLIWADAIRPTLTDLIGDAWIFSTPKGLDYFHTLYQFGTDPQHPEWGAWQRPTAANPFIDPHEIESARQTLPERTFSQEYLAQFLSDGGGVFRGVDAVCTARPEPQPVDGHVYVFGIDWAKSHDFTVVSVIDATTKRQVWLDRSNQVDMIFQAERIRNLAERYRPTKILAENNSLGMPMVELLRRSSLPVIPWTATNATKQTVIEDLSVAMERQDVTLLADPVQLNELLAYDVERLPSGLIRYSAPQGMHDDCVIATALAWQLAKEPLDRPKPSQYQWRNDQPKGWDPFAEAAEPSILRR
jgi:hypothetical protein